MEYEIIPGILRQDKASFEKDFLTAQALAKTVQVDVVDGMFAPTKTIDWQELQHFSSKRFCEIDLMVVHPEKEVEHYDLPWVNQIVIHLESTTDPQALIDKIHHMNLRCAVAQNAEAKYTDLLRLKYFDQITFMSVTPGAQGQAFQEDVVDKIVRARADHPDIPIEVDGGMTPETLPKVLAAGANKFVSGSYIFWHDDPEVQYQQLQELLPLAQTP